MSTVWPYHPDLLATPVPRYTSFPTAAEFGDIDAALYPAALAPFIARDLATLERGHLASASAGLPYARTIAAIFDPYRGESTPRFSSAV